MAIAIQPYSADLIPAVKGFNRRLVAGGVAPEFHFPENNIPHWLPKLEGHRIHQEYYLAVDGDCVRGGFILKYQDFFFHGKPQPVVYYHLPISEGIVNKAYVGMGGFDRPLPQMLKAMGWSLCAVPFYFRVNHPAKFLRGIAPLRETKSRRLLLDLAAVTGVGWAGIR